MPLSSEELVRRLVARHRPDEIAYFDEVTALLYDNPEAMYAGVGENEPLAAELGVLLVVLIPVLYSALNDLARDAAVAAGVRARRGIRLWLHKGEDAPQPLDPQRRAEAKQTLVKRLRARDVPADEALQIAEEFLADLSGTP